MQAPTQTARPGWQSTYAGTARANWYQAYRDCRVVCNHRCHAVQMASASWLHALCVVVLLTRNK